MAEMIQRNAENQERIAATSPRRREGEALNDSLAKLVAGKDMPAVLRVLKKMSVTKGASIDGSDQMTLRPLMSAAGRGSTDMVKVLIDRGANLDARAPRDVYRCGDREVTKGERAIHCAVHGGHVDNICALLKAGADVNATDTLNNTPLVVACVDSSQRLSEIMVKTLLRFGADPSIPDKNGNVPLHTAGQMGYCKVVSALVSNAPGTLNHANIGGFTTLAMTAGKGQAKTVDHLLRLGARQPPESPGTYGCPVVRALKGGHAHVVRLLLDRWMDSIGGVNKVLPFALYEAMVANNPKIVRMLLGAQGEARVSRWARSKFQHGQLLHFASAFGFPDVVGVLLAAGADETIVDRDGQSAHDIAGSALEGKPSHGAMTAAILRVLERGPAFRARSFLWPVVGNGDAPAPAAAGGCGVGRDDVASAKGPTLGVQIFRTKRRDIFVRHIGR